jgi:hypothetical protein
MRNYAECAAPVHAMEGQIKQNASKGNSDQAFPQREWEDALGKVQRGRGVGSHLHVSSPYQRILVVRARPFRLSRAIFEIDALRFDNQRTLLHNRVD